MKTATWSIEKTGFSDESDANSGMNSAKFRVMSDVGINHRYKNRIANILGTESDAEANAKLIASAPEMLEIVKEIVQHVEGNGLDKIPKEEACAEYFTCTLYYCFAKDLLAKAGGE